MERGKKEFYNFLFYFLLEFYILVIFSKLLPLHFVQGDLHFYLVFANFVASWSWPILQLHYMFHTYLFAVPQF